MGKYKLKEGAIVKPYGVNSLLTNEYLNDGIVEMLIAKGRAKEGDFIITQPKKKTVKNKNK
mgnify:CR=1 FL=1